MNERDFCFWLNGFFDLTDSKELSEEQVQCIKEHLALVFNKVAPDAKELLVEEETDVNKLLREYRPLYVDDKTRVVPSYQPYPYYPNPDLDWNKPIC